MSAPGRGRWAVAALCCSVAAAAFAGESTFLIRYRSAANVYLDGGAAQGLTVGDRLTVAHEGKTSAELEVVFLAEQSASCRVISETRPVGAGDSALLVRPAARAPAPQPGPPSPPPQVPAPTEPAVPAAPPEPTARSLAQCRGSIALGYSRGWDWTLAARGFEQRMARLDVSAWEIGGQPLTFNLRFRGRQDERARSFGSLASRPRRDDRLYELSLRYEPPSGGFDLELGRIGAAQFSSIGYLDGALARVRLTGPLQLGGFFGRRAEPSGLDGLQQGRKYGGFLRLAPPGRYAGGYELILAGVREFAGPEVSREFLALESRFGSGGRLSFYERAELDVNRGWREPLSGRRYQLSNLALSANLHFAANGSFLLSYDNRTNYRSSENRTVPQAIFDDFLQQGLRAQVYLGPPRGLSATLNGGIRLRQREAERAYSYGGGLRHGDLFGTELTLSADYAGFSNRYTAGYLISATTGRHFGNGHYLDVGYGRSVYRVTTGESRSAQWLRLAGRLQLPRGLYCVGDFQYDRGDDLDGPRALVELGYQF
jgi:hypothetical protein